MITLSRESVLFFVERYPSCYLQAWNMLWKTGRR